MVKNVVNTVVEPKQKRGRKPKNPLVSTIAKDTASNNIIFSQIQVPLQTFAAYSSFHLLHVFQLILSDPASFRPLQS